MARDPENTLIIDLKTGPVVVQLRPPLAHAHAVEDFPLEVLLDDVVYVAAAEADPARVQDAVAPTVVDVPPRRRVDGYEVPVRPHVVELGEVRLAVLFAAFAVAPEFAGHGWEVRRAHEFAAFAAAIAGTAHWLDAHPVIAIVAAIVAIPLVLAAIRKIWRVK